MNQPPDKKITQEDIEAGGDVVAGSKLNAEINATSENGLALSVMGNIGGNLTVNAPASDLAPPLLGKIDSIIAKYQQETVSGSISNDMHENLAYYLQRQDIERTLQEKLTSGGRASEIRSAEEEKEYFYKRLDKYTHYPSAQRIYAFILDCVESEFKSSVEPLLKANESNEIVDQAITQLVDKCFHAIPTELDWDVTRKQIRGMIFFLTERCLLNWDKVCP